MDKNQLATRQRAGNETGDEGDAGRCRLWGGVALCLLLMPLMARADPSTDAASAAVRMMLEGGMESAPAALPAEVGHNGIGLKAIWQLGRISAWSSADPLSAAFPFRWDGARILGAAAHLGHAATVRYDSPSFFGLNAVAEYSSGQNQAGQPLGAWSFGLGYQSGRLFAEYGHEVLPVPWQGAQWSGSRATVDRLDAGYSLGLWTPRISLSRGSGLNSGGAGSQNALELGITHRF